MNFVKNQLQCEIFKMKNQSDAKFDNFFKQRMESVPTSSQGAHTQSSIRLQINNLKTKCKILQTNIEQKDEEIAKLKQSRPQLGPEEKTKAELKRAHNILKTLRKRLKQNQIADGSMNVPMYDNEYLQIMGQIQEALGMEKKVVEPAVKQAPPQELESMEGELQNLETFTDNQTQSQMARDSQNGDPATIQELRQKMADLKQELEMSPR